MKWHPDVPDLPINKPKQVEYIESLDPNVRDSLPGAEVNEMIDNVAYAVAAGYQKEIGGSFEGCLDIVSVALNVTGSSLGGSFGTAMVAANQTAAKNACKIVFNVEDPGNGSSAST